MPVYRKLFSVTAAIALTAVQANAQGWELGIYGGIQTSPHSGVEYDDGAGGGLDFTAGWEGRSFEMPPYYGIRGTYWMDNGWGFGLEFTHSKVYADDETRAASGFTTLEFTDGLNITTANAIYRWQNPQSAWTPYVGGGVGFASPHVEVIGNSESQRGYQITGPALRVLGGVSYALNDRWSVFGEYNGTYSMNEADLGGGASLRTNIITNAVNVGVSFSF